MIYAYITGEFDVDSFKDEIFEVARVDDNGKKEQVLAIETARDLEGLNVTIIGSNLDFRKWINKNGPIE